VSTSRARSDKFVVENVAGAGGTIGSTRVMRANPDGYTIHRAISLLTRIANCCWPRFDLSGISKPTSSRRLHTVPARGALVPANGGITGFYSGGGKDQMGAPCHVLRRLKCELHRDHHAAVHDRTWAWAELPGSGWAGFRFRWKWTESVLDRGPPRWR
jgi:hypothetical protein